MKAGSETAPQSRGYVRAHLWLVGLGWIASGLLIFFVVLNYALSPLYSVFASRYLQEFADAAHLVGWSAWWAMVAVSCAAAVLLIVVWPKAVGSGRRALVLMGAGFSAYWCWYLLNRWLDVWGVRSSPDPTPDFFLRANLVAFASQAIDVISAVLIIVGAILLRRVASKPEPIAV